MMKNGIRSLALAGLTLGAGMAGAQTFSTTLGTPGFSGSYVAAFLPWDDGTGESLYAVGSFTATGVAGSSGIVRWDGSSWQAVGGGLNGNYSNVLASFQGDLYAGGYFSDAGGVAGTEKLAKWDGTTWSPLGAGLSSFLSSVWDLVVFDDGSGEKLYIGGNYLDLGGNGTLDHIARFDGTNYEAVGGTIGGNTALIVLELHVAELGAGDELYAGGRFFNIDGNAANNIAKWNGTTWEPLGGGLARSSGTAQVICMTDFDDGSGNALYVGGSFNLADGNTIPTNVTKWDGTQWTPLGDGFNSVVQELVVFDDGTGEALYALGNFATSGANPMTRIAKWNGTAWEAVGGGLADGNAFGGIVYDTGEGPSLVIGGSFVTADGQASNKIAALLADASPCIADFDGNGNVNILDVVAFITNWNAQGPGSDFNGDTNINILDVVAFITEWNAGCP